MKFGDKYKKILIVLVIILVSGLLLNTAYAAITVNKAGNESSVGVSQGTFANVANGIVKVLSYIGEMSASGLFATIAVTINVLCVFLFLILQVVFVLGTGDITHIPMPDTIVFNRFAFFDPNFINPANNSLVKGFGSILKDLFASFQTVAIAIFIVAAMIAGIKMALSTVAAKKAQYKESAMKWVTGFTILMCLRIIIAGIFYLNEYLVAKLYSITGSVSIPVYVTDAIPIFGKLLTDLVKSVSSIWGGNGTLIEIDGYLGIVIANIAKSIGGDIISSVVGFIILGQTLTIVGSYLKRTFMCILLGIISPLIVAADTVMAVQGKQSSIFKNWLKNFTITVFMQSIHAMYMVVVLQILSKLYARSGFVGMNSAQIGIVTIVLTTGLVKLEKMFKTLFGIGDSFAGDLKDGARGMVKAMGAVKGLKEGISAVTDNKKKSTEAGKRKKAYMDELNRLKGTGTSGSRTTINNTTTDNSTNNATNNNSGNASQENNGKSSGDFLQDVLNNQSKNMTREEKIQKLEAAIAEESAKEKAGKFANVMGVANLVGGLGIGLGMGDEISESLFKGGYITKGLDFAAEKVGYHAADNDRRTFLEHEQREGERYGYTPSEKIIREKTKVEEKVTNGQLYINPAAVAKEWSKQMKEVGEVFGDTMKKQLKEIDKDVDNQ